MKILGYNYTVELLDASFMSGNMGYCNPDKKLLQINKDADKEVMTSTLIHEIIEALDHHLELRLNHNQIMSLEVGIFQVLNDNGVELISLFRNAKTSKIPLVQIDKKEEV